MTLTLDVPADALRQMMTGEAAMARQELINLVALQLYTAGELPIGKAISLAGLTRAEFDQLLKKTKASRPFDEAELARDLTWIAK
jgi:predicted HTH domain antitoxin